MVLLYNNILQSFSALGHQNTVCILYLQHMSVRTITLQVPNSHVWQVGAARVGSALDLWLQRQMKNG